MADVLVDDAPRRLRRVGVVGAALVVAVVAGGTALRGTLPPPPVDVELEALRGTALQGDGFAQVRVALRSTEAREVEQVVLRVAGTTATGRSEGAFDDQGTLTVHFEVTPDCDAVTDDVDPGALELAVRDVAGDAGAARVELPADGPLGRLLRSSCELQEG